MKTFVYIHTYTYCIMQLLMIMINDWLRFSFIFFQFGQSIYLHIVQESEITPKPKTTLGRK